MPKSLADIIASGVITAVDTQNFSCRVTTDTGEVLFDVPVPGVSHDKSGYAGAVKLPSIGQRVRLHWSKTAGPLILAYEPASYDKADTSPVKLLDSATPYTTSNGGLANYRGNLPKDLLEGDNVVVGTKGEVLGVLSGSGVMLRASPMSQLLALGAPNEGISLYSQLLKVFTGAGELYLGNDDGKPYFEAHLGFDQLTETGSAAAYTFNASMGKNNLVESKEFKSRDKRQLFREELDFAGNIRTAHAGTYTRKSKAISLLADDGIVLTCLNKIEDITTAHAHNVGGSYTLVSGQNIETTALNDNYVTINRDYALSVGRLATMNIGGNPLTGKPGDKALAVSVANGDLSIDVGPPGYDLNKNKSSFNVTTWALGGNVNVLSMVGDVNLESRASDIALKATKAFNVTATNGNTKILSALSETVGTNWDITVGGKATLNAPQALIAAANGIAVDPAVLWNELYAYLQTLTLALDTHTHQAFSPMSPTSPPMVPTFTATLNSLAANFRSKKVMLGG